MGLKYHLGHTGYLAASKSEKLFLTKSSISLTRLADMAHAAGNIEYKLNAMKDETLQGLALHNDWAQKSDYNEVMLKKITARKTERPSTLAYKNINRGEVNSAG